MAQVFRNFMTGVQAGHDSADRQRARQAQEAASRLMTSGDRAGAARALMSGGLFGEAATLTNVIDANDTLNARRRAGSAMASGRYDEGARELFTTGDLAGGREAEGVARNREAGALLMDDPRRAAAVQALGGDLDQATALVDWADRADERERQEAISRASVMAPVLANVAALPYEQRRAAIQGQAQALGAAGFTPEQIQSFDPTDQNIRALTDSVLGLEKVLGSYSMREVGDEVRTYRANPYGVQQVGAEPVPYTRAEARQDRGLELEEERLEIARRAAEQANSTGDVLAPLLQRYAKGEQLTAQESEIVRSYLDGRQSNAWGMPVQTIPGVAPAPIPNGNRTGVQSDAARAADPPGARQPGGPGSPQNPARPQTDEDYARLPAGSYFIDPGDGQVYRK